MATLTRKSDRKLEQEVREELAWDRRVAEAAIHVAVDDGAVTLTGIVDTWGQRVAAQEAAHRVLGVRDVADDLVVHPPRWGHPTDTEIAKAVRRTLEWDVFVPDTRITTTVSEGWVTLEGAVATGSQREAAKRAVRNLAGVRGVTDKLTVQSPKVAPAELRACLCETLRRQVEQLASRIGIEIEDGAVTLTGTVHSWAEKQAILGVIRDTRGVRSVDDQVHIDPAC